MSNRSNFSWEFACPKFVDFQDPKFLELNSEVDSYFDSEHEFSFNNKLSEALKVESILAAAESMASPGVTPSRPASSASNYRTPPDSSSRDLESEEVFYTTRKSYDLRETECRRLKQIGASPYRIPGGTSTSKKKSRRPPFTPKVVEENAKQIEEEEELVQSLKKILFSDIEEKDSSKDEDCENSPTIGNCEQGKENSFQSPTKKEKSSPLNVTQGSNDYSMELMIVSPDTFYDCNSNVVVENETLPVLVSENIRIHSEKSFVELPVESTEVHSEVHVSEESKNTAQDDNISTSEQINSSKTVESSESFVIVDEKCEEVFEEDKVETVDINREAVNMDLEPEEKPHEIEKEKDQDQEQVTEQEPEPEKKKEKEPAKQEIPKIRISRLINSKSSLSSPDEGQSKSTGGFNSDNCWTDVDDENAPTTSKTQEKRRRPLRRESFVKSSATLASTVKKGDPQKRLYRLLSYTAPPKNKYRSLAELSRDFETKIRAYTPPNLKSTKAQWTPTKPVSPKLTACKRKRTLTCVSHKEQEESIAQSIKKNTFKATPFNKKTYMSTVNVGVKRVDPKPTTKPIPFSFRSEKRIEARRSKVPADLFNKLTSESAKKSRK